MTGLVYGVKNCIITGMLRRYRWETQFNTWGTQKCIVKLKVRQVYRGKDEVYEIKYAVQVVDA